MAQRPKNDILPLEGSPDALKATARAAFREIRLLSVKIDEHSKEDKEALNRLQVQVESIDEMLTSIRVEQAGTRTALETMALELRHHRDLEKIEAKGNQTARVERHRMERERLTSRAKVLLALIAVLATIAGAIATSLTT